MKKTIAVIVGSAFGKSITEKFKLEPITLETEWGEQSLFRSTDSGSRPSYVIARHGIPHRLLPNQINYRAQCAVLKKLNCGALLINSSVGVMDAELPLYKPMLVTDLMMTANHLPDGTTCTMFPEPTENQGHLLIKEGLFSNQLNEQLQKRHDEQIYNHNSGIVFVYAGGPRGKTPAENKMWALLGGQVNSMTLAPEVVLANELQIPTAALVVGHKYSVPGIQNPNEEEIAETLNQARQATENIIGTFLFEAEPVPFENQIYHFDDK